MNKEIHIGCSAYNNGYWKGIFYPEKLARKDWFDFYTQHFNTYEINGTFYNFPRLKTFQDWFDKTPDDFVFSVKAPKTITHIHKFIDCETLLEDFYSRCAEGLQHKLVCILFQFPPSYDYSAEKLELIVSKLNLDFRNVIEFRHASWWVPEVWDRLKENKITFCSPSLPKIPDTIFSDSEIIYIRLHGKTKMFYSSYNIEELIRLKEVISNSPAKKVFIYFNNTASTSGVLDALAFKKLF